MEDTLPAVNGKTARNMEKLGKEYSRYSQQIRSHSQRMMEALQAQEEKLPALLRTQIPVTAGKVREYLPGLDSMQSSLQFLAGSNLHTPIPLPTSSIQSLTAQLNGLTHELAQAENLQDFAWQRQAQLKSLLQQPAWVKYLQQYQQTAWYYREQINQYKALLHDPDKLSNKVLTIVRGLPAFRQYMLEHSQLSTLFRLPGSTAASSGAGMAGLQTHDQVAAMLAGRLSSTPTAGAAGSSGGASSLSSPLSDAQGQLNTLKEKYGQYGYGNSQTPVPDFRPNPQHTRTFLQRIQLGLDIQSQQAYTGLPALTTVGLNIGYKLNDRLVTGLGGAYKMGWGQPFDHINLSSQGASLRSFFQWKWKGSIWLTGGWEANYLNAFSGAGIFRQLNDWQSSGLTGLMKTYKAGKRQGNLQLLYDWLHAEHLPHSPALLFRAGYTLGK